MDSSKVTTQILQMLRGGCGMSDILQYACQALTESLNATRCVAWIVVGDGFEAKQECSVDGKNHFQGAVLNSMESMTIVLQFLSRFTDESMIGVVSVPNIEEDAAIQSTPLTLRPRFAAADTKARLLGQLRSRGIFSGFIDIQQSVHTREWTESDCHFFEEVLLTLSVMVQLIFDVCKVGADFEDLTAMHNLTIIFQDNENHKDVWKQAASLVASHLGFEHSQIYLESKADGTEILAPQIDGEAGQSLDLTDSTNEIVEVFRAGRGKICNLITDSGQVCSAPVQGDMTKSWFGNEMAVLFPLKTEEKSLGVLCLWQRLQDSPRWIVQQRDVGVTLAQLFADYAKRISRDRQ